MCLRLEVVRAKVGQVWVRSHKRVVFTGAERRLELVEKRINSSQMSLPKSVRTGEANRRVGRWDTAGSDRWE